MTPPNDYPYYRQTWNRIVATLLAAAFVPLTAIGGGVYILAARNARVPASTHVIALLIFLAAALLIIGAVLLVANDLAGRLESKRRSLNVLDRQLRRTSYLSSSMELSMSYFEDIQQTLMNIDSSAAVLREHPEVTVSQGLIEDIDQIAEQVRRGRESVERFLIFIREEPPLVRDLDVREVLDHLLAILDRELRNRRIRVRREYQSNPVMVRSDRSKLRQVFQNIVLNAVAAMDGGGEIALRATLRENRVTVTISDTGPGIPPQDIDRIFEPLWTTKPRGTGLGLPICRDILQKIGGTIDVSSPEGQGTTVTIGLACRFNAQPCPWSCREALDHASIRAPHRGAQC